MNTPVSRNIEKNIDNDMFRFTAARQRARDGHDRDSRQPLRTGGPHLRPDRRRDRCITDGTNGSVMV